MNQLDRFDWAILNELQMDGRLTNAELAQRVGLSAAPCWRRVRALEESPGTTLVFVNSRGLAERFTAKLNDLEPYAWLRATLEKLPAWPHSRIDELLPLGSRVIDVDATPKDVIDTRIIPR
mgnify:CR=1 FL=1